MSHRTRVLIALAALGTPWGLSNAQTADPRIGHWAQQPGPRSVGMHVNYEDLGDDRFRLTLAAHSAPAQRQAVEAKCDGGTYPFADGNGKPTGNTLSCRFTAPRRVEYLFTAVNQTVWATSTASRRCRRTAARWRGMRCIGTRTVQSSKRSTRDFRGATMSRRSIS